VPAVVRPVIIVGGGDVDGRRDGFDMEPVGVIVGVGDETVGQAAGIGFVNGGDVAGEVVAVFVIEERNGSAGLGRFDGGAATLYLLGIVKERRLACFLD
jgi:hypothetical protein